MAINSLNSVNRFASIRKPLNATGIGQKLININGAVDNVLRSGGSRLLVNTKSTVANNAQKGLLKYFSKFALGLEKGAVKVANSIGSKIQNIPATSTLGKFVSKVPGLNSLGNGLSKVTKLPGLGVLFVAGEALYGAGKGIVKLAKGDYKGAAHQLIKSGVTLGGQLAGLALIGGSLLAVPSTGGLSLGATLTGIAMFTGADIASRWVGDKIADKVVGESQQNNINDMFDSLKSNEVKIIQGFESDNPFNSNLLDLEFDQFLNKINYYA